MGALKPYLPGLVTNAVFLAILLVSAGTLRYPSAWVYAAIGVVMTVLSRRAAGGELAQERARPGAGAQGWDKKLLAFGFLLNLAVLVVAGLDTRHAWSPRLGWPWSVAGAALSLAGMALFLRSMKENRFFSAVVRVQRERGHAVCTTGPYRVVRHPGYAGMIVGTLGMPLLLLSAWSAIPAVLSAALLIVRTALEDALLARELEGYRAYQAATRYRLIPGIW